MIGTSTLAVGSGLGGSGSGVQTWWSGCCHLSACSQGCARRHRTSSPAGGPDLGFNSLYGEVPAGWTGGQSEGYTQGHIQTCHPLPLSPLLPPSLLSFLSLLFLPTDQAGTLTSSLWFPAREGGNTMKRLP